MSFEAEVAIVGSGLNGLAAAVALAGPKARRPVNVAVVDRRDPLSFTPRSDGRALALTASARRMLEALGAWEALALHAEAMRHIVVTDSKLADAKRPALLEFGEEYAHGKASAYLAEVFHIQQALVGLAAQSSHIRFVTGEATGFHFAPGRARISLADGGSVTANLIVAADGRASPARAAAGIDMTGWDYDQSAIVTTVEHDLPHQGRAFEHFLPAGPFAILPLPGNRSSIVWTERRGDAERIMAFADEEFAAELLQRFGDTLGAVRIVAPRFSYPLAMYVAKEFVGPRLALVGDAAHIIHPIAGLGFNLGLRDVAALAECVADAVALGLDPGGAEVLDRYASWRRFDTVATAAAMEGLNRLFSSDNPVLRLIRDAGIMAVDRIGPLKSLFMKEAAGQAGSLPRLMRGEAV
ncbi:MAG: FAD-dependent monooxygenase [Aestuariivirga sp.]